MRKCLTEIERERGDEIKIMIKIKITIKSKISRIKINRYETGI